MTDDYVKLSLAFGFMAGVLSKYPGGEGFLEQGRSSPWELTWEKYEAMKLQAARNGVPISVIGDAQKNLDTLLSDKDFLKVTRRLQESMDQQHYGLPIQ